MQKAIFLKNMEVSHDVLNGLDSSKFSEFFLQQYKTRQIFHLPYVPIHLLFCTTNTAYGHREV